MYFFNKKKEEVVMNEVFTIRLCVEAKKSRWETSCQQLWTQHWLHSKWWPGRGVCELKKKLRWVVHIFKRCQWKRGVVSKKSKKVGQSDTKKNHVLFLGASWQLNDLIFTSMFCLHIFMSIGPHQPTSYNKGLCKTRVCIKELLRQFSLFKSLSCQK